MVHENVILDRMKWALGVATDSALSRSLGVPRATVASWRRRSGPPLNILGAIRRRTGVSIDWLLGWPNDGQRPDDLDLHHRKEDDVWLVSTPGGIYRDGRLWVEISPDGGFHTCFPGGAVVVEIESDSAVWVGVMTSKGAVRAPYRTGTVEAARFIRGNDYDLTSFDIRSEPVDG